MASALYALGRESFLKGEIAIATADIRAILVDTGTYTPNLATDQFLSSITGGARISVSGSLTGKTTTNGIFDADDVTFTGVSGATVEAIVLYCHDGGSDAARRLIAYIDSYTGLVYTPSGANVTVVWPNTTNKIFKL